MSKNQTMRVGVGAVIVDQHGRVLVLERADTSNSWQFPQGGMEEGEDTRTAVQREVREETGIAQADLLFVAEHPAWLAYELPNAVRKGKTGRGQVQKWFLFRVESTAPDVQPGEEFQAWDWRPLSEAVRHAVSFRRSVYRELARAFAPLIGDDRLDATAIEYVRLEYEQTTTSLLSNEDMGERRLANYLTFIGLLATATGLVLEHDALPILNARVVVSYVAAGALILGLLTFRRLLKRNRTTTKLIHALHIQRTLLSQGQAQVASAAPFQEPPSDRKFHLMGGNGGLAETSAAVNSLIAGSISASAASVWHFKPGPIAAIASGTALLFWCLHVYMARKYYKGIGEENS